MGGLGVFAWLAIGVAAGWVVSRLMVGAEDDTLRGTAAGMAGGILGGLGMRLLAASPETALANTSLGALAGSLWLTWITCVVTSGRRRDSREAPPQVRFVIREQPDVERARPTLTYAAARGQLVDQLLRDAMAHEAERYDEVGRRFDSLERVVPHGSEPELAKLRVALALWGGWIDARDRGWPAPDGGIAQSEWPLLARTVAADLEDDRDVTDARIMARFDVASRPSLGNRVQALAARMRVG